MLGNGKFDPHYFRVVLIRGKMFCTHPPTDYDLSRFGYCFEMVLGHQKHRNLISGVDYKRKIWISTKCVARRMNLSEVFDAATEGIMLPPFFSASTFN